MKSIDLEEINRIKKFNTFRDYRKFIKRVEEAEDERFLNTTNLSLNFLLSDEAKEMIIRL